MPAAADLSFIGLMPDGCELHLVRDWEAAWRTKIRPWLAAPARLRRDYVIVPTRGQAHALKLRCVRENLPLLGVEFLTPALARQKLRAAAPAERPAIGRELLLLNLRSIVAERLAGLDPGAANWGVWKSLESDAERALDDFDELLRAGFAAADFEGPAVREAFGELERRVAELGFDLAPRQQLEHGLRPVEPEVAPIADRMLFTGFAVEHWAEFFPLAALARRARELLVLLPEPEFNGRSAMDEAWVEAWATLLGVEAQPAEPAADLAGAAAARCWGTEGDAAASDIRVLVGRTRLDEMELVAGEIAQRLNEGATNIAVVFPAAGPAHQDLVRRLSQRGIPFNDLLPTSAPVAIDVRIQRAILDFQQEGGRVEQLLEMWPMLRALNFTQLAPAGARDVAERAFDARQTHAVADLVDELADSRRAGAGEFVRVARLFLPVWPDQLPLEHAARLFETTGVALGLPLPEEWPALRRYAATDSRAHPREIVLAALRDFLPDRTPAEGAPGRGQFAPVTLTTRRRADGCVWSDLFLVESNAGRWPQRRESSGWLTDDRRVALNERARFSVGLFTADDRAHFDRTGYMGLARNTTGSVVFSASRTEVEDAELGLAPNAWLERILMVQAGPADRLDTYFERLACAAPGVEPIQAAESPWLRIWTRRRDPQVPFDQYFLSGDPAATRPARLSARLVERGVTDPAELWFGGVLGLRRADWRPLARARKRMLGSLAHGLLARALRGESVEGDFVLRPPETEARRRLREAVAAWRRLRPRDRYWDSFAAELGEMADVLLRKAYAVSAGPFAAIETDLPPGTTLPLGRNGPPMEISGRIDLVWSDRPRWTGAHVDIVDFKTGADARLSAAAMARGASLQLGLYLAAAQALGAAVGRVWMLKPDGTLPGLVDMSELPTALTALEIVGRHITSGVYGALTPDRTEFTRGLAWPLACAPIRYAVLERKHAVTFGETVAAEAPV